MKKTFKGELFLGIVVVLLGIALLSNNLGLTEWNIWRVVSLFWPVLLLYWGISYLVNHQSTGEMLSGFLIVFLGLAFLGSNFGLFEFSFQMFWQVALPVILIFVGINLIRSKTGHHDKRYRAILGGLEKKGHWQVEDGSYLAFMGGIELDLREAEIPLGETTLYINAIMGGVEITVPRDLKVICEGTVYFGGMELFSKATGGIIAATTAEQIEGTDPARSLQVYVRGLMGGIEIKAL